MDLLNDKWIPIKEDHGRPITHVSINDVMNLPLSSLAFSRFEFHYAFLLLMLGLKKHPFKDCPVLGKTARFIQNSDAKNGTRKPINLLLLDSPSENAIRNNTDHFVKRDNCQQMCISCAVIALYVKTQFFGAGGPGLRPGIYYNTVIYFLEKETVREAIEANTSDDADVSVYFSTPNYYWLDLENTIHGECSMCGRNSHVITHFWQKGKPEHEILNYGVTPHTAQTINDKRFIVSGEDPEIKIIDGCSTGSYKFIPPKVISNSAKTGDNIIALNTFYNKAKLVKMSTHRFKLREKIDWRPIKDCVECILKINSSLDNPKIDFTSSLAAEIQLRISENMLTGYKDNEYRASLNVLDMYCPLPSSNPLRFMKKMEIWRKFYIYIKILNKARIAINNFNNII
ncbi:type I-E CRISPR-associated protein Cse1/CasA [Xenorhabdus bovienii]|uniref:type I-E CRISPR-associated protein Cse1/CasA n=1 Tax=Xenorhabdus bovienii TaxID=40576 RepID=UPI0023B2808B|nr:type I-E CRISPR-associated protein Cse1/CasA [Xenorhabdus bovienii]MDE9429861.1 hypothetical protein [Xenorhabdus bovienii]